MKKKKIQFKLWSQINKNALKELKPNFGFRSWNELLDDEKKKIWLYLWKKWFFSKNYLSYHHVNKDNLSNIFYSFKRYPSDKRREYLKKLFRIIGAVVYLNNRYKAKSYARKFLENDSSINALDDFYRLFFSSENVTFELLSAYAKAIILERFDQKPEKEENESEEDFVKRVEGWRWEEFDEFANDLNDVFEHFGVYVILTRQGFVPRQSKEIVDNIYTPTLEVLSSEEYADVSLMLGKAFKDFRAKQFDKVIQNSINAIHAYLQLEIHGKIGKKESLSKLLTKAQSQQIIPYSKPIVSLYDNIDSFLAKSRQKKTDAHPSKGQATQSDALFVLNLTMIVLQSFVNFKGQIHC